MRYLVIYVTLILTLLAWRTTAQNHPFAGGSGTETDPYQIETPAQLDSIRGKYLTEKHYILTADLDFADYNYADGTEDNNGKGWLPIAHDLDNSNNLYDGEGFQGVFHGKGHVIRNLFINRPDEDNVGLFSSIENLSGFDEIDSLGLEEVNITGHNNVGGMTGGIIGNIYVGHSYVTGRVTGTDAVGGLTGNGFSGTISQSYADVQVRGTIRVGGLAGYMPSSVPDNYATGQVTGTSHVGGLGGTVIGSGLHNNYATGLVIGDSDVGGLLASMGIPFGLATNSISNYWNTETTEQGSSYGEEAGKVTGLTTAQMYVEASFSGWDFTNVWLPPVDGVHFPLLRNTGGQQQVTIAGAPASVSEADGVTLTLTRTGRILEALPVNIAITQTGSFATETAFVANFDAGEAMTTLTIPTDDDLDEEDGSLTATVEKGARYTIGTLKDTTVMITDDDLQAVTVAASTSSIMEGEDVTFTLTREGILTQELTVNLTVAETGGVIPSAEVGTKSVTFAADVSTATLSFSTTGDIIKESDGSITVTIADGGTNYRAGSPATVTVIDAGLPEVTITTPDPIGEGEDVDFTLTRTGVLTQSLDVEVTVAETGGIIPSDETGTKTVTFAADASTATHTVPTINDETDEADGTVTVTIEDGASYTTGDPASATVTITDDDLPEVTITDDDLPEVTITDDDLPEVTITAGSTSVSEADGSVVFTLTRDGVLTGTLEVDVTITQTGGFTTEAGAKTVTFSADASTATLTISLMDDADDEPDGSITATIASSTDYTAGDPVTVTITDVLAISLTRTLNYPIMTL